MTFVTKSRLLIIDKFKVGPSSKEYMNKWLQALEEKTAAVVLDCESQEQATRFGKTIPS